MFVLSKLISAVTQPMFWLGLWWLLALLLLSRWRRGAVAMLWAGLLVLGLLGFKAVPDGLLRSLENQYAVPTLASGASGASGAPVGPYAGVIVLGGAIEHPDIFIARGQVPLGDAAERMTVAVGLLRQHPSFELIFAGGEGRLMATGITEADLAEVFFTEQGLDMSRVRLESGSRNTRENAQKVSKLLGDRCQEPWLLITSAGHMPRSLPEFEAVGCNVTPYPVDFRTGYSNPLTEYSLAHSLVRWQQVLHEWLGQLVYRLTA